MQVVNKIRIWEVDGSEEEARGQELLVCNTHRWPGWRVAISLGGKEYVVDAEELRKAIQNCMNA